MIYQVAGTGMHDWPDTRSAKPSYSNDPEHYINHNLFAYQERSIDRETQVLYSQYEWNSY